MTDNLERVVEGEKAEEAFTKFVGPAVSFLRDEYMTKLVELAARPLDDRAVDGIRNLSIATRVLAVVEEQMRALMANGEIARQEVGRAAKIANMTPEARRYAQY